MNKTKQNSSILIILGAFFIGLLLCVFPLNYVVGALFACLITCINIIMVAITMGGWDGFPIPHWTATTWSIINSSIYVFIWIVMTIAYFPENK